MNEKKETQDNPQCLQDNPYFQEAQKYKNDGTQFFNAKAYDKSQKCFVQAATILETHQLVDQNKELLTKLYSNSGICDFHLKRYENGKNYFAKALKLDSSFIKARVNLVKCLVHLQDYINSYEQIVYIEKHHKAFLDPNLKDLILKERQDFMEKQKKRTQEIFKDFSS